MLREQNLDQARAWDGDEGAYWSRNADRYDRAVAPHHASLMSSAAVSADDRVLDVGCGTGQTTRDAARLAHRGSAVGIDLSSAMLEVARSRAAAEGLTNVEFLRGDAQVHQFEPGSFDLVISRTGAMFFADPGAAFTNLGAALRAGGRLALIAWQGAASNEWLPAFATALAAGRTLPTPPPDAPGPFALSDPDRVLDVLTGAGFVDVELLGEQHPMWFGDTADEAFDFVLGQLAWMLGDADEPTRERAERELRATMAAHETRDGVTFGSATWTIMATRP